MKGVVLAAGKGTRMGSLTDEKPKSMLEVVGKPILDYCFESLIDLRVEELVAVVGYKKQRIIEHYADEFQGVPIRYAHQREQKGLAHALLAAEKYIDDDFVLMHGDNIYRANLGDVIQAHSEDDTDAAFLVEEVSREEARKTGVFEVSEEDEVPDANQKRITGIVEKPDDPPSNLVITGSYVFSPAVFHACHLIQPSHRGEYELSNAVNLLIRSGRTVRPVELEGWRININTPEDIQEANRRIESK